jgi:hypothetical protein
MYESFKDSICVTSGYAGVHGNYPLIKKNKQYNGFKLALGDVNA